MEKHPKIPEQAKMFRHIPGDGVIHPRTEYVSVDDNGRGVISWFQVYDGKEDYCYTRIIYDNGKMEGYEDRARVLGLKEEAAEEAA